MKIVIRDKTNRFHSSEDFKEFEKRILEAVGEDGKIKPEYKCSNYVDCGLWYNKKGIGYKIYAELTDKTGDTLCFDVGIFHNAAKGLWD